MIFFNLKAYWFWEKMRLINRTMERKEVIINIM